MTKQSLSPEYKISLTFKVNQYNHYISHLKKKNHIISSTVLQKSFAKIQNTHPCAKLSANLEQKGIFLIKSIQGKPTANITLHGEKSVCPGKIRNKAKMSEVPHLFDIGDAIQVQLGKTRNEIKGNQTTKKENYLS